MLKHFITLVVMPQDDQAVAQDFSGVPDALLTFLIVEKRVGLNCGCVHN